MLQVNHLPAARQALAVFETGLEGQDLIDI